MNNIKSLFVFLLLSLSSLAALAMPSVADVEATIASGDYAKAKTQLNEVLKANPNSYVANRYMLEIIRIENARDNIASMQYKIYEDKLAQIEKAKAAKLLVEKQAREAKAAAERSEAIKRGTWTFLKILFWALLACGVIFGIYLFYQRMERKKEEQRKLEELEEWKGDVRPDLIDLNQIFKTVMRDLSAYNLSSYGENLLHDLNADNIDALDALNRNDFNVQAVERHIRNARDFIEQHGLSS